MDQHSADDASTRISEEAKEKLRTMADHRNRDENGHFIPLKKDAPPSESQPPKPDSSAHPLTSFLHSQSSKSTDKDDTLVDVHVNNPLKRITQLLEDIKKEKAFSFNIKGSLGLTGVILVVTSFGIFGGTQVLCSRGEQAHIGTLTVLTLPEEKPVTWVTRAQTIWDAMTGTERPAKTNLPRLALVQQDEVVYRLVGLTSHKNLLPGNRYLITGEVDACTQTITIKDPRALQLYE